MPSGKKMTQAEFLAKAVAVHGVGRYDYSQTVFLPAPQKIVICCPEHGVFTKRAACHLAGQGCPSCGLAGKGEAISAALRMSIEEFILKAKQVHGDKYSYEHSVYNIAPQKISIECPQHGVFLQVASSHLGGAGCPNCGRQQANKSHTATLTEFISKAVNVHGNKFDYSQSIYTKARAKMSIVCPTHGAFEQTANAHLAGKGCWECGGGKPFDGEEFINKAQEVHLFKYDYSQCIYTNTQARVTIICPQHGAYSQIANSHLQGRGCPSCGRNASIAARCSTTPEFIQKAMLVHGSKYSYSSVVYLNHAKKITITCKEHGLFSQTPNSHLNGSGCPACGREIMRIARRTDWVDRAVGENCVLYFVRLYSKSESFFKVGITYKTIKDRFSKGMPYDYEILACCKSQNPGYIYDWEQSILETFSHLKYKPSLAFGGSTECFSSYEEILNIFSSINKKPR